METRQPPKAQSNKSARTIFTIAIVLLLASATIHFNAFSFLLITLSLAGAYVCRLAILYLFDKNNPLTAKWCSIKGNFDCGKVLDAGKFSKNIHLGDVGLVYFMGQFLFLLFSTANRQLPTAFMLLGFPVALASVVGIFSVCYQALVVKSWCKMCLAVVGTLWLQALVLIGYFVFSKGDPLVFIPASLLPVAFIYAGCQLAAACWFTVPPIMAKAAMADKLRIQNQRWKKDGGLFLAMLEKQRTVDTAVWENDFVLGNSNAPIQMVEAVNLYCKACAGQHRQLHHLLLENPKGFQLVLRFRNTSKEDSKHTVALRYILNAYFATNDPAEKLRIIDDWYAVMDLQKWQQKWPALTIVDSYEGLIKQHREWFAQSKIAHTPTLFVGGYEFPSPYVILDLKTLSKPLLGILSKQRSSKQITFQPHEN